MGMDSYFLNLVPLSVSLEKNNDYNKFIGQSNLCGSEFVSLLVKSSFNLKRCSENSFVLDDVIKITIYQNNDLLIAVTLEGCFAWFNDGLKLCYRLAKYINDYIITIRVLNPIGFEFQIATEEDFINTVRNAYEEKYLWFIDNLADWQAKVLPGKQFFELLKQYKRRGILKCIIKIFKK